jgi:2',3'-cyclic-nucleotide 2'-phosphodiesterase (5'-nucleotidase family)
VRGFVNDEPFGELIDFAEQVGGFDFIFGDHTNIEWSGVIGKALVSMNLSKGLGYSRTVFQVDPVNGRIVDRDIEFVQPLNEGVTPDPAIQAMIDDLDEQLRPILGTVIGEAVRQIPHSDKCGGADGRTCESLVGNVTTDAMRTTYGVDFAITNSGGLRSSLTCPTDGSGGGFCTPYTPPPWLITRGQVFEVLPFGNIVATLRVDGALLKQFLENGVSRTGRQGRFPQVSGLCFTYDVSAPAGSRVTLVVRQAADGTCTGGPVDLASASTYSLAINDFIAGGGDGYPNVSASITTRDVMDQVLADYVAANSPLSPSTGRITCTTSGATACPVVTP